MTAPPRWLYVQARLQARHGESMSDGDWRALEAAGSFGHFLERTRATPLRRFTGPLNAGMTSHAIERMLRLGWRNYVAEIAGWLDPDWQPAMLWTASLADLPSIEALLRGETPVWIKNDASLAGFADGDLQQRMAALEKSPLAPLAPAPGREASLARRWSAHWQSLWPRSKAAQASALRDLTATVAAHVAQLAQTVPPDNSASHRQALVKSLTRLFRRHGASPAAVFCHLALVALDIERLRGGLTRRRLFEPSGAQEAA